MATMTETQGPTLPMSRRRKSSRTEVEKKRSLDGQNDKKRGRPKVDKHDESAADRRRTQIRMAQRAYRQRKESTLEELRKRVSELTNTIELMNRSFLDFSTRFEASGLSTAQSDELETLALRFEALVKDARNPADDEAIISSVSASSGSVPTKTGTTTTSSNAELEAIDLIPQVKNVPSWLDQSAVSSAANRPNPSITDMGLGYTLYDDEGGSSDNPNLTPMDLDLALIKDLLPAALSKPANASLSSNSPAAAADHVSFTHPFFIDDHDPFPIPHQPSPPRTFSFQESTFARRLHRACLERGYQLLLDPDMRPATYERVFRLSLLGRSRAKILNIIQAVLARGPHQGLDFWEAPLIHVGGAGTHYPPRDAFGNLLPKRQSRNIGKIGPQTLALLDNASREQISIDMTVEIAGYEGEWFDPHDVQGYLEEKGIFIDPSSTFAEVDMVVDVPSGQSEPVSAESSLKAQPPPAIAGLGPDETQWDDLFAGAELTGVGFSDAETGSFMNFLQPGESIKRSNAASTHSFKWTDDWMDTAIGGEAAQTPQLPLVATAQRTRKVVLDLRKLIKELTASAVCLGRAPGFRRKDVDHAVELAIVEAF